MTFSGINQGPLGPSGPAHPKFEHGSGPFCPRQWWENAGYNAAMLGREFEDNPIADQCSDAFVDWIIGFQKGQFVKAGLAHIHEAVQKRRGA